MNRGLPAAVGGVRGGSDLGSVRAVAGATAVADGRRGNVRMFPVRDVDDTPAGILRRSINSRAASRGVLPVKYETRAIGSPLSSLPIAKSHQTPSSRTLKDPGRWSLRVGFRTTYS